MHIQEKHSSTSINSRHVNYTILKARGSDLMFMDEIEKKHFLDMLLGVQGHFSMEVFAYCVLDGEAHILNGDPRKETQDAVWGSLGKEFASYQERKHGKKMPEISTESTEVGILENWQLLRECIKLQQLPVLRERVQDAEDYWWSSLREYMLRHPSGIVQEEQLLKLLDGNRKKAIYKFRRLQREAARIEL